MREAALRYLVESAVDGPFGSALTSNHYSDEGTRVVRLGNIGDGYWRDADRAFIPQEYARELRRHDVRPGDVVVAGLGDANNPLGRSAIVPDIGPAIVKADCFRVRLRPDMLDNRYFVYFMSARGTAIARERAHGSTRQRLPLGEVLDLPVPVPQLAVQRRIADYLDTETARIDTLVQSLKTLDDLLVEKRVSVTLGAVVGHLTSDEGRRPTNLNWVKSLPESWGVASIAHVARLGSGHTPSRNRPEFWVDCTVPWVTTGEVSQMRSDRLEYLRDTREKISELGMRESSARLHPEDSVVLCRTAASAGYSAIMAVPMATSQDIVVWTCGPRLRPRYLLLCLRAMRRDLLDRLATGSTHRTIYMPDVEGLRIPLPPVEQQDAIVEMAWQQLRGLDRLRDEIVRQHELLAERRQALITAAVTGEIEV